MKIRLPDVAGQCLPTSESQSDDLEDRWSYPQFGTPFQKKYCHLRNVAAEGDLFSEKNTAIWLRQKKVADAMGLTASQWSNVRTKTPPQDPVLRRHHLAALARHFEMQEVLGDKAWKLFLPSISLETFKDALMKARYGSRAKKGFQDQPVAGQYIIPRMDRYTLRCPATLDEYDQTVEISKVAFGEDLIDLDADRDAFLKNPYGMVVLVDSLTGRVLGWIDIYHLPNEDFELMIREGEVRIDPSRIIDFPGICKATRGYTASILIDKDYHNRGLVRYLLYGLMEFLLQFQFQGADSFELFAVGETKEGVDLLERFEFSRVRMVQMEAGPRPLYSRQFKQDDLLSEKWGFWSKFGIYRSDIRVEVTNPLAATTLLLS